LRYEHNKCGSDENQMFFPRRVILPQTGTMGSFGIFIAFGGASLVLLGMYVASKIKNKKSMQ